MTKSQRKPGSDFSVTHHSVEVDNTSVDCFGMHIVFWIGIAKHKKKKSPGHGVLLVFEHWSGS